VCVCVCVCARARLCVRGWERGGGMCGVRPHLLLLVCDPSKQILEMYAEILLGSSHNVLTVFVSVRQKQLRTAERIVLSVNICR
jgi:hypothetical protein